MYRLDTLFRTVYLRPKNTNASVFSGLLCETVTTKLTIPRLCVASLAALSRQCARCIKQCVERTLSGNPRGLNCLLINNGSLLVSSDIDDRHRWHHPMVASKRYVSPFMSTGLCCNFICSVTLLKSDEHIIARIVPLTQGCPCCVTFAWTHVKLFNYRFQPRQPSRPFLVK